MADTIADVSAQGDIFLGADVEFKGELNVPGCAHLDGKFEGVLHAKALIVGQSGRVSGQIHVDTAEIHGWTGDHLNVQSHLLLRATGCISGTIGYSKIVVEEGGEISGTLAKIAPAAAENPAAESTVYQLPRNA
jgi:cytoskeletal protein CcmA (bactofilin family)